MARSASALIAGLCFAAGGLLAWHHPLFPVLALASFYGLTIATAWRPGLWLFVLPAALPAANFAPWTGWLSADEFDLVVLACLTGGYLRLALTKAPLRPMTEVRATVARWLPVFVGLTGAIALGRGLSEAPLRYFDWFQGYTEPVNGLRVAKSLLWACLAVPLLRDALRHAPVVAPRRLAAGMVFGLACVCLAVLWERAAFPGLFDFTSRYRITALFWEMHVGGAAIDGYLALAAPFVIWALRSARTPAVWLGAALLAVLGTYAALTTFSRGVYLSVVAPLALLAGLLWMQSRGVDARDVSMRFWRRLRPSSWRARAAWALAAALVLEVVGVLNGGSYMGDRIATADRDFGSRVAHWERGLQLLHTPADWLLGRGLGRLPALYSAAHAEGALSGRLSLSEKPGQGAVRPVLLYGPTSNEDLGGLFAMTQRVSAAPGDRFRVRLHLQTDTGADLHLQVCERHLLYNGACQYGYAHVEPGPDWQSVDLRLRGRRASGGPWYAPRPSVFTVSVLDAGQVATIDGVSLSAQDGREKLLNTDFADGLARWFPSAQSYFLPWHIDNLYLELLIERGALGLFATLLLVGCALWRLVLGQARWHALAPYLAASLSGVMVVGLVSSVMDVPRVAFLLFWMAFLALQLDGERPASAEAS